MKTRNTLALAALVGMGMLGLTSCNEEHDLRTQPPGTGLLALGEVTVAGTDVAGTRAAIIQDAAGFIGIRKTEFKAGDVLALSLSKDGTDTQVTAELTANGWTIADRTYYAAGTKLTATYTPAAQPGGIKHKDVLTTDPANPVALKADGNKQKLTLVHANAMLEITPPAGIKADYTISVKATPTGGSAEDLATVAEGTDGDLRYRTIALPGKVTTITLTANGITYTATLNSLQVEANKRYPIALSVKDSQLTATVNPAGDLNWGADHPTDGHPAGYSRYIGTAEDLAQYAKDMMTNSLNTAVLQIADIDLSTLRTAAEANTYYNTNKYNYTATKENWMPIANGNFHGSYNGNGYTISNLTITQTGTGSPRLGLFRTLVNAKVTGVHLRNCQIKSTAVNIDAAGALAAYAGGSTVTLCSATGSVSVDAAALVSSAARVGGLIGWCNDTNTWSNHVNRCSSDVAVSLNSNSGGHCGAFVGLSKYTSYAACIASGTVTKAGVSGTFSGFTSQEGNYTEGYRVLSCITNSEMVNTTDNNKTAFGAPALLLGSIATQPSYSNFAIARTTQILNCICLGTLTEYSPITSGISFVTADQAYKGLTQDTGMDSNNTPITTLHWSKEDGYTLTELAYQQWDFTKVWVPSPNGLALPTLDMSYEGTPTP